MNLFEQEMDIREKIFNYFEYIEDWRVLPFAHSTDYFWKLRGEGPGIVCYADTEEELESESGQYFENEIYTQRHLSKWVYRGEDYTMVVVDTHTDGNQFLQIFDNSKERPDSH